MRRLAGAYWPAVAALAAISVAFLSFARTPAQPDLLLVVLFGALAAASENGAVLLPTGIRLSCTSMMVLASLVALDGDGAVLGAMLVAASAGLVARHLRARRHQLVALNCSNYALAGAAAAFAYQAADVVPVAGPVAQIVAAIAAFAAANVALVLLAVAIDGRVPIDKVAAEMAPHIPGDLVFASLGTALGLMYRELGPATVLSLAALLLVIRAINTSLLRGRRASGLVALARRCAEAGDLALEEQEAFALLDAVREKLNADVCELTLVDEQPGRALRICVGPGDSATTGPASPDDSSSRRGIRGAITAEIACADGTSGTLLVANRRAMNSEFAPEDFEQLETVAALLASNVERHRLFTRLRQAATHDMLTGLLNRHGFLAALPQLFERGQGAVLLLDVDGFKQVNETLGSDGADAFLRELAQRLADTAPRDALVGRTYGDEFAIALLGSVSDALVDRLQRTISAPFAADGTTVDVTASIGISRFPEDGVDALSLVKHAEVAMYAAKERRSGVELYQADYERADLARMVLVAELKRAIEGDELFVVYQPKINVLTGRAVGCEALVRWAHPDKGVVPPAEFIGLAEQSRLIKPLTLAVLRQAARDCVAWRARGHELSVAVNLSVPLLLDEHLVEEVALALAEAALPASALTLEITESDIMRDSSRSISVLKRLSAMGVQLSIDDFGTGYSSLAYLRDLPVDEVKIDRSFIQGLDAGNDAIVRLTLELAHTFGLSVVAEGVESDNVWERLRELSCDQAQGYLFAEPLDLAELEPWLVACDARAEEAVIALP